MKIFTVIHEFNSVLSEQWLGMEREQYRVQTGNKTNQCRLQFDVAVSLMHFIKQKSFCGE